LERAGSENSKLWNSRQFSPGAQSGETVERQLGEANRHFPLRLKNFSDTMPLVGPAVVDPMFLVAVLVRRLPSSE